MRDIKVWIHDGRIYQTPHYVPLNQIEKWIQGWKDVHIEEARRLNADHYIYCTKTYNKDAELREVDLYQVGLSDSEFEKRIAENDKDEAEKGNSVMYGVWHKRTAY